MTATTPCRHPTDGEDVLGVERIGRASFVRRGCGDTGDNTTVYTTGITAFDNTTAGDPSYSGNEGYKGLTFAVPSDVPPLRVYHYNEYQSGYFDAGREVPISGSSYVTPVTGITQGVPPLTRQETTCSIRVIMAGFRLTSS